MRKHRSSFLLSLLMVVLCGSIIIGSTLAYFTSEQTTGENIIAASTLKAGLDWAYQLPGSEDGWQNAANGVLFNETSWEPNYSAVRYIRVKNGGSLAFSYELNVLPTMVVEGGPELMDVIDVYYGVVDADTPAITRSNFAQLLTRMGTMTDLLSNEHGAGYGILLPEGVGVETLPAGVEGESGTVTACIVLHMQQQAGNEYMGLSAGEGFKLQLAAVQYNYDDAFANIPNPSLPDVNGYGTEVIKPLESVQGGMLAADMVFTSSNGVTATVPAGAKLDAGVTELKLIVTPKAQSDADVTLQAGEALDAWEVRVEGLAKDNTVPVRISLGAVMQKSLNIGNYDLYHVEGDATNKMTRVDAVDETSAHNSYSYDPATGEVEVAMATFSEVTVVASPAKWEGNYDYTWYASSKTDYIIANADQLAGFSAIVGGMDGQTRDSFAGKTVKLIADIDLNDGEDNNAADRIFYPIGYKNSTSGYIRTNGSVTSGLESFEGIFDGNGHTISNFYQNTWEMFGDYNEGYSAGSNYYKDGMGLFGYVVNGTVKNLTVDNFSSDGEFTPTGVIAAYAVKSTFENIAITNCNPRVYNTGNGGIVGIGGNSDDPDTYKLTFTNITIDNTNKISALWGSWDVACGGLVGMFRGDGDVYMTNCHVAAQMDVYNDVCGNYQYYWYRYSGMLVGTNMNMTTDADDYTVPETDKFHAKGCTVHFGEWNDYYYCELVANSLASYTHDHQFSRLEQVDAVDENNKTITIDGVTTAIPTSGRYNYVVVDGEPASDNATCYHFVDGAVWNHIDAGFEDGIDEDGDGENDLKEDKQHIYRPFNQLFTGYGWGVKHIPIYNDGTPNTFEGVKILDTVIADSVDKFKKADTAKESYAAGTAVNISELFSAVQITDPAHYIKKDNVQVFVSPVGADSTVSSVYNANKEEWFNGTLTFYGKGSASVTITDYYFCEACTIYVTIEDGGVLYRVGNMNNVTYAQIAKLLTKKDSYSSIEISKHAHDVDIVVSGNEVNFGGTGIVKVTIDGTVYYLEVVEAMNTTTATSATANNVVLLNDCSLSSLTISGRYAFYGNGFTATYTGNGQYLNNGLKMGVVNVSGNGVLDNLRIRASIYPKAYLYYGKTLLGDYVQGGPYTVDGEKTRYHYQLSAVSAKENATISNCYIYGGRNNIYINTGDVTIKNTILECATVANVQIQSNSSHTIKFEDVTTIQYRVNPTYGANDDDYSKVMLGAGILVGPETFENPTIVLNGDFKQYNWVNNDDANAVSDELVKSIITSALDATAYNHIVDGQTASNLGIIFMNEYDATVTNNTDRPYVLSPVTIKMAGNSVNGKVCSLQNAKSDEILSDYENADRITSNSLYQPQFKYSSDLGGQLVEKSDDGDEHLYREGDNVYMLFPSGDSKELDLAGLIDIGKYSGQDLNLRITTNPQLNIIDNIATISDANEHTITYTVTDSCFYDENGYEIDRDPIDYSWDIKLHVSLKDAAVPNARFEFDATMQKMGYYKPSWGDVKQYLPFLAGLKIYDYVGQKPYLRFDGDSDYIKIASINIEEYVSNEAYIEVKLTDGGIINTKFLARADSAGGSTYTGKIKTNKNIVYFVNDGGTSNKESTTTAAYWYVDYYKFTGNNGVAIQSAQQTFTSTGSSASTPSGTFATSIKYTVTYDANEGICAQNVSYATSESSTVTLPVATRSGYIFAGWYTATTGGTRAGRAGDSYEPSTNITLYAQWGKPCTVSYNANGGTCSTASEKYSGDALTLPTPARDGYWFSGWYDAATGGNKIGDAGVAYNPNGDITLYAHWQEKIEYTVTYNANGGNCGTSSATYQGTALTLPTPTRTGYKFLGWYTAASGGTKIGDAGKSYTPNATITLYAQWEQISYTITISKQENATVTVDKTTAHYNDTISVTVSFTKSNKTLTVKDNAGTTLLSKSAAGTYTFTMPASNVFIEASSSDGCVASDTLVRLADGSTKEIQHISYEDQLLVWDFFEGRFAAVPSAIIFNHGEDDFNIIHLTFEDGTVVKVIYEHRFLDVETHRFVRIDEYNALNYVGRSFYKVNGDQIERVKLVNAEIKKEHSVAYSLISSHHYNFFVEDLFSSPFLEKDVGAFEYFEIAKDDLKYTNVDEDINNYGLYTYDDFAKYISREQYDAFNAKYMKIAVGKGDTTFEEILRMINEYLINAN